MTGPRGGYALSVDLGTSNTVAVLRWPDGRTRPLLFDGQPVMPSGVFLDATGRLHVGRDAQRFAQAEPARYEPNPKRRVDERTILLGDREVLTVDLLAAVLRAVADSAVEAIGFLPPAVLTFPASWGARRRQVLAEAVTRAGWPPVDPALVGSHLVAGEVPAGLGAPPGPGVLHVQSAPGGLSGPPTGNPAWSGGHHPAAAGTRLVPEPVAAARYFAEVLNRPVPVGSSLVVFDFGGGTLDIAIVRNEGTDPNGRARFVVIGSGGLAELGGLDLDAALVDHLGQLVGGAHPGAWHQLAQPATSAEWRNRRQFWNDVRGAKEMLSRAVVAPVPVPGVEQAVHLTREELERVISPLLRRGVVETAGVIANCRLAVDQIAGLFLVGGSSRVPLVARLLHAELGIAPTVLEQPELPVAEGALAELGAPPATSAVPAAAPPTGAAGPIGHPPTLPQPGGGTVAPSATGSLPEHGAGVLSGRRRPLWIGAGAAATLLAVVIVAVVYFIGRPDYDDLDFHRFSDIDRIVIDAKNPQHTATAVVGDRAYLGYAGDDNRFTVIAVDADTATVRWRKETSFTAQRWRDLVALPNAIIVLADDLNDANERKIAVLDPKTGNELWKTDFLGNDSFYFFDDVVVHVQFTEGRLLGLGLRTGQHRWDRRFLMDENGNRESSFRPVTTAADLGGPTRIAPTRSVPRQRDDQRLIEIGADRSVRVIDALTGDVLKTRKNVADPDDAAMAHAGRLYIADESSGYRVAAYDLESLAEPAIVYTAQDADRRLNQLLPCGREHVCLLETKNSDRSTAELVAVDAAKTGQIWRKSVAGATHAVPVGEHILVQVDDGADVAVLFDREGRQVRRDEGFGMRIDGGNLLLFQQDPNSWVTDISVAGIRVNSAEVTELGLLKGVRPAQCSWNTSVIVCPGESDFVLRRFAKT